MINNNMLTNVAKALNGESFVIPTHQVYSSTVQTIAISSTSLTGEIGTRITVSKSRTDYTVTYNAVKTGTTVGSAGEYLNATGLFSSVTNGELLSAVTLPSIYQTSAFDIDCDWEITISRT